MKKMIFIMAALFAISCNSSNADKTTGNVKEVDVSPLYVSFMYDDEKGGFQIEESSAASEELSVALSLSPTGGGPPLPPAKALGDAIPVTIHTKWIHAVSGKLLADASSEANLEKTTRGIRLSSRLKVYPNHKLIEFSVLNKAGDVLYVMPKHEQWTFNSLNGFFVFGTGSRAILVEIESSEESFALAQWAGKCLPDEIDISILDSNYYSDLGYFTRIENIECAANTFVIPEMRTIAMIISNHRISDIISFNEKMSLSSILSTLRYKALKEVGIGYDVTLSLSQLIPIGNGAVRRKEFRFDFNFKDARESDVPLVLPSSPSGDSGASYLTTHRGVSTYWVSYDFEISVEFDAEEASSDLGFGSEAYLAAQKSANEEILDFSIYDKSKKALLEEGSILPDDRDGTRISSELFTGENHTIGIFRSRYSPYSKYSGTVKISFWDQDAFEYLEDKEVFNFSF